MEKQKTLKAVNVNLPPALVRGARIYAVASGRSFRSLVQAGLTIVVPPQYVTHTVPRRHT